MGVTGWAQPGERVEFAVYARWREVGSRIGGQVRVPHPAPPDAPATVDIKQDRCPLPAPWTGEDGGPHGWVDDDAVGWWAEAADPGQVAARMADSLTVGRGQSGVFASDRRIAVVLPEKLLAPAGTRKKGLLGKVGGLLENTSWAMTDPVVSLWETDARALRGWSVPLVGRGFPFARVVRFDFADGSALLGRTEVNDLLPRSARR